MLLDSICANLVSWLMPGSTTRSFFWSSSVCWVLRLRTSSFVFSRQEGPDECILLRSVFDCVKIPWCLKSTMGMYRDYSLQQVYQNILIQYTWWLLDHSKTILRKPFHNSPIKTESYIYRPRFKCFNIYCSHPDMLKRRWCCFRWIPGTTGEGCSCLSRFGTWVEAGM